MSYLLQSNQPPDHKCHHHNQHIQPRRLHKRSTKFRIRLFARNLPRSLHGLSSLHSQTHNAQKSPYDILPYYYAVVVFVSIFIFLTCLFVVGTILAWNQSSPMLFRCTLDRVLLPIFIFCGFLVWIFTSVFLTLGVLNGDFCFDTPDAQMNKILAQTLYHQSRVAYNVAYYYVNGCPSEYQSNLAQFAYARILEARGAMLDFNTLLQNFFDGFLSEACGAILVSDGGESPINYLGVLSFILLEHLQGTSKVVVAFADAHVSISSSFVCRVDV